MGIDVAVENPPPVMDAGQVGIVYAMGSVEPSLPIVSLFACADEQATVCAWFLVHFTVGDVLPASVVAGVSVAAPDGSMLKVIEPFVAEVHVSITVPVASTVGVKVAAIAPLAAARTIAIVAITAMVCFIMSSLLVLDFC
jgi:hypothetical protein